MTTPTLDADIVIVGRPDADTVIYERLSTGGRWVVRGQCNQCGLCVIGAVGNWYEWNGPAGTPYACNDTRVPVRLDEPIIPGFIEDMKEMARVTPTATVSGCSLSIEEIG